MLSSTTTKFILFCFGLNTSAAFQDVRLRLPLLRTAGPTILHNRECLHAVRSDRGDGDMSYTQEADTCIVCATRSSRRTLLKQAVATAATGTGLLRLSPSFAISYDDLETKKEIVVPPIQTLQQPAMCDATVITFRKGKRFLFILGTAHISDVSANLSKQLVREVKPDAVFIELDLKRISRAFRSGRPEPGLNIGYQDEKGNLKMGTVKDVPQTGASAIIFKILSKAAGLVGNPIQSMYKKFETDGFVPGAEFINAVEEGLKMGSVIVLGDQDMNVTLRRIAQALASTDPKKLAEVDMKLTAIMKVKMPEMEEWQKSGTISPDELKLFIERIKTKDTTKLLMDVFRDEVPKIHNALVSERDLYMARNIDSLSQFQSIVAIMGLGHLDGVGEHLQQFGWTKVRPSGC